MARIEARVKTRDGVWDPVWVGLRWSCLSAAAGLARLAGTEEPPPLLHPAMGRIYRTKVTELAKALQEPDRRSEAPRRCAASWTPSCSPHPHMTNPPWPRLAQRDAAVGYGQSPHDPSACASS
jgi:hypothetical protein